MPIAKSLRIVVDSSATNSLSATGDVEYVMHPESDAYGKLVCRVSNADFVYYCYLSTMEVDGNVMMFDIRLDGYTNCFQMVFLPHDRHGMDEMAEPNSLLRDIREMVQNYNKTPSRNEVNVLQAETLFKTNSVLDWNMLCRHLCLPKELSSEQYFRLDNTSGNKAVSICFEKCDDGSLLSEVFDDQTHAWTPIVVIRDCNQFTIPIGQSELFKVYSRPDRQMLFKRKREFLAKRFDADNEILSRPQLPTGVISLSALIFRSPKVDEERRDHALQFLGSALEREDGVTDEDRSLARETLVEALASTNATFAGTALRALHRGDPADPLVASNALRIARDPSYPSSSRITALLILEDCVRSTSSTPSTLSTLAETASAVSADPSASSLLRQTAEAVLERNAH